MRKLIFAALASSLSAHAAAQGQGTATLYSKGHFAGFGMPIAGPTTNLGPLEVKSLKIPDGSVWELCSGNTFSGCKRFSQSKEAMVMTVRSARPVAAAIPESVALPSQGPISASGPSLHGLASEYFVVPAQGGSRIEVNEKAAGAASAAATEFCRGHGWRLSAYERVQTISGRTFLADVLCANDR